MGLGQNPGQPAKEERAYLLGSIPKQTNIVDFIIFYTEKTVKIIQRKFRPYMPVLGEQPHKVQSVGIICGSYSL